ncbi:hypothetical protein DMENIID0001_167870 [Sergentomyia squamirostris]
MAVLKILLPLMGLLVMVQATLEVCVCCDDRTGQPVTEECDIPAKSFTDNELTSLEQLCYNLQLNDNNYYSDSRYETYRSLKYIVLNGSRVDYNEFSKDDCSRITREWKGRMFWIPEGSSWTLTDSGDLLSRKVVNISDFNNENWFQWLRHSQGVSYSSNYINIKTSQSPNLNPFNGTYEFVLRIIPSSNVIHDIKCLTEKKTYVNDPVNLGQLTLDAASFSPGFSLHIQISNPVYYKFEKHYPNLEIHDGNTTVWASEAIITKGLTVEKMNTGMALYPDTYEQSQVFGKKVNIEKSFKANMTTILLESSPVNEALTTVEEITGTKFENTIEYAYLEPNESPEGYLMYWMGETSYLSVSDRTLSVLLFILAGILLIGSLYVCMKKACCCCVRDRVAAGYTSLDNA